MLHSEELAEFKADLPDNHIKLISFDAKLKLKESLFFNLKFTIQHLLFPYHPISIWEKSRVQKWFSKGI